MKLRGRTPQQALTNFTVIAHNLPYDNLNNSLNISTWGSISLFTYKPKFYT